MRVLIDQLPPAYHKVITLYFFEEKNGAEVAAILGLTESRIHQLIHRGVELLRTAYFRRPLQPYGSRAA